MCVHLCRRHVAATYGEALQPWLERRTYIDLRRLMFAYNELCVADMPPLQRQPRPEAGGNHCRSSGGVSGGANALVSALIECARHWEGDTGVAGGMYLTKQLWDRTK